MKRLAIIGASGHGKVVAEIAELLGWHSIDFFDAKWPSLSKISKWPVIGDDREYINRADEYSDVFVAIGDNLIRSQIIEQVDAQVSVVHPSAVISSSAVLGKGVVVMAGAVVNADVRIANGCIINTGATIDHDCSIGAYCHISPGANIAGGVSIGTKSWIGIGSSIIQCKTVGNSVVVGAGAAVVSDIPDNVTAVGVPAKFNEF